MHKNYKDPGCYSEFKEMSSMEAKFIFAEDKIIDNNAPIDSTIRVWSINKINKNFTSQYDTDNTQDNIITVSDSKIDKVVLVGSELSFYCGDNKIFSFNLTMQNIDFSSIETLINSKIDTVEIADKTITFKANGTVKGTVELPKDIEIINDLTTGGRDKALSAESIKPITEKLTENVDEVISARRSYFGKTFSNLKRRLDKEFEYTSVDNIKGMFSPFSGDYNYNIQNSLEGTTKDIEILGEAYQNLSPFGDKTYTLNKQNHTGTTTFSIPIPSNRVITIIFNVLEKTNIQEIMCRGYDHQNVFKEFARATNVTIGRNVLVLKNELNGGIKSILLAVANPTDSDFMKINEILILDGDYTNKKIPPFFLGIKSSNEIQNNELKIKSYDEGSNKECIKTVMLDTPLMSINKANLKEKFHDTLTSDGRIIRRVRKRVITYELGYAMGELLKDSWTNTHALFLVDLSRAFNEVSYPEFLFADNFCFSDKFISISNEHLLSIKEEGINVKNASPNYIGVCILKSRLKTTDIQGFVGWLKDNPLTVYYSLHTPYEEKITPIDFNLETFSGTTYVESANNMQFITNFKAPINITSSLATYYSDNEKIKNKLLQIENNSLDIDSKISTIDENLKKIKTLFNIER